ncbi:MULTISPECIES: alpha/beta hydrolase [Lactiplantibacillus]|uniref:Carboxylesterase n=1 Tax=Lactiplantibacillus pentosus TaxID=1589 RepID=A0ABX5CZ68_LACPE|nr:MULTISPECIES: alpha/beta fold hydrolase [Lactiplantibacillus]MCM8609650.1 alpha/beta fold hydrolase [Lactiplantibacillus sp. B652]PRO94618.1 carboxylesterase [Lactiplantibacillus pentosus]
MMLKQPEPFYFEHGERAVILLHAYAGSANDVRMLGRTLERSDYTVYGPQFSGHATNDPRDILAQTPDQWWQDTQQAISFLRQKGYTEISIFGLSLGGIFATAALERDPQLLGGGTFSSPLFAGNRSDVAEMFITLSHHQLAHSQFSLAEREQILAVLPELVQQQLQAVNTFTEQEVTTKLANVTQPFFIGQGGQDELIDPNVARRLQAALTQVPVDFHWYADAGHVITVNNAHHQLEQDVLTYLKSIYK